MRAAAGPQRGVGRRTTRSAAVAAEPLSAGLSLPHASHCQGRAVPQSPRTSVIRDGAPQRGTYHASPQLP